MKYVVLNDYQVGLVFRNGAYNRMITSGGSWTGFSEEVYIYDISIPFPLLRCDLNILLKDKKVMEKLEVIHVKDGHIALLFENGNFTSVLGAGRYSYWKGVLDYSYIIADLNAMTIPSAIDTALLSRNELQNYVRTCVVEPYEKALLFINGNFDKVLDPGTYYFWKNSIPVSLLRADTRLQQLEITGQEILTKDKANLRLNLVARYKVVDVKKALLENRDMEKQLYTLLQLAFREYVSNMGFDELLEKKEVVSAYVMNKVTEKLEKAGIELADCGIRDIILPGEVKEIMNQVLVAEKKAQANNIMRREETASTRSLMNTARLMEENAMLFRLKEMEYVERIAEKITGISVGGDSRMLDQLRQIFSTAK